MTTLSIEMVGHGSHHLELNHQGEIEKEEVYLYCNAVWRGQPVRFTISCDRYRHSSGLSEWRCYVREAEQGSYVLHENGNVVRDDTRGGVTETARLRLSEASKGMGHDWLCTNDYYPRSFKAALLAVFRRRIAKFDDYSNTPARLSELARKWADDLGPARVQWIYRCGEAFTTYQRVINNPPKDQ